MPAPLPPRGLPFLVAPPVLVASVALAALLPPLNVTEALTVLLGPDVAAVLETGEPVAVADAPPEGRVSVREATLIPAWLQLSS